MMVLGVLQVGHPAHRSSGSMPSRITLRWFDWLASKSGLSPKSARICAILAFVPPCSRSQVEPCDFCSGGEPSYELNLHCAMMLSREATTGGASWQWLCRRCIS